MAAWWDKLSRAGKAAYLRRVRHSKYSGSLGKSFKAHWGKTLPATSRKKRSSSSLPILNNGRSKSVKAIMK